MPETYESHLVRDQGCMAEPYCAPNQELQHGFALLSPSVVSHCHPTQIAIFEKPCPRFPNHLFQFRQCVTVLRSIGGSNLQKVHVKINATSVCKALCGVF
ncbi:hypothetical protein TNCV_998241 [Trichonephila clavipes]|nr:hypothetical protein TNCV_998241 [Trichonephila clavipes]